MARDGSRAVGCGIGPRGDATAPTSVGRLRGRCRQPAGQARPLALLARGSGATTGAGDARVTLKVAKKARKRLKRQRRVKTTLVTRTLMAGAMTEAEVPLTLRR